MDYTSPEFILQNISLDDKFETFENFSSDMRLRVIRNITDQVCFYISCVLKGFIRSERAPSIVVYGAGFLGSTIVNALIDCGCRPFLRVFTRDKTTVKIWNDRGIKASSKLREGSFIDILILSSNLASFVQFCRDLSPHISPKTFIITTVFGLRRKRLFNILGTPGIFKTFVERRVAFPSQNININNDFLTSNESLSPTDSNYFNYSNDNSTNNSSFSNNHSPNNSYSNSHSISNSRSRSNSPTRNILHRSLSTPINHNNNKNQIVALSPMAISARFLAGTKDAVRNMILILENYLILSGIPAMTARADALDSIVGASSVESSVPLSVSDHIGMSDEEINQMQQEENMAIKSDLLSPTQIQGQGQSQGQGQRHNRVSSMRRTSLARSLSLQAEKGLSKGISKSKSQSHSQSIDDSIDDSTDSHENLTTITEGNEFTYDNNNPNEEIQQNISNTRKDYKSRRNAVVQAVPQHIKLIRYAINLLNKNYSIEFKKELSKHILVINLPTISSELSNNNLIFTALKKQKKITAEKSKRNIIGRTPTRGLITNSNLLNWDDYFLKDAVLLQIFSCDSKSDGINDIVNPFVLELDEASDEDGDDNDNDNEKNNEENEEENQLQKQFYDRYYVKQRNNNNNNGLGVHGHGYDDGEEIIRTKAPMNLQGLSNLTFDSLATMMKEAREGIDSSM